MKKTHLFLATAALLLISLAGCKKKPEHEYVAPLPSGFDMENLTDARVPAVFGISDLHNGMLTMEVYSEDLYDAVAIHLLAKGDTLLYDGEMIIVDTIVDNGSWLQINGGLYEGGADLEAYEGGTYRAVQDDDHSIYTLVGTITLPVSDTLSLTDCGDDPTDPSITIQGNVPEYISTLPDYKQEFYYLDTRVLIEYGVVTNITRVWIP